MAEWKAQVSYNYTPSYHTYACSLVYQPAAEQNRGNLNGWVDNGATDQNNYNGGATQHLSTAETTTAAVTEEESTSRSPETNPVTENCFQGTGFTYLGDTQTSHLVGPSQEAYAADGSGPRLPRGDSVNDSDAHTSPDSWSSVSSREGSLPQVDPTTWVEKEVEEELVIRSPGGSEDVSSSLVEDSQNPIVQANQASNNHIPSIVPLPAPKKLGANTATNPKTKVRAAFSEGQMNALVQRFSVQRYLTPAEMKNLAERTGLTYKQVKTWFQNRRMKLRRHQKDTSWVSERYAIQKDGSAHRPVFSNMAPPVPPYQGDGRPQFREHYNQHMMGPAFQKTPQNLGYYLAAVGGTAGSAGYQPWPANAPQATVPNQHHAAGWSVPQGGGPFDCNPNAFNSNNYVHAASFESKGEGK
ncbi:hypothetical protein CHARACLAT_006474 [Characodon lateralis]|uniref:Homeobox domain-containing protein n=1 Tax=Characodon lateralis TaxID=208331 RepID=A0ABU7F0Z9_9TELE|nr:hypothetical protein [Characodon lateralis]